jgi:hypothetical protein
MVVSTEALAMPLDEVANRVNGEELTIVRGLIGLLVDCRVLWATTFAVVDHPRRMGRRLFREKQCADFKAATATNKYVTRFHLCTITSIMYSQKALKLRDVKRRVLLLLMDEISF